jgi:hypothetical protein
MDDKAIDQAIFSMLSEMAGWRKVAAVVGRVADAFADDLPDGDAAYQTVARRIEALVGEGRLVAQGNIQSWRFSEVRLPG